MGEIVGLEDAEGDAEKISEFIKNRIRPVPPFKLRFETIDEKKLVILDVFAGEETPYYYAADGVMEAYTRIGNESVLVDDTEHKRLVLRGKKTSYDSQSSGYKLEDFSFTQVRARYKKVTGKSFEDKDYKSFGMADKGGVLTYAGALLNFRTLAAGPGSGEMFTNCLPRVIENQPDLWYYLVGKLGKKRGVAYGGRQRAV